MENIFSIFFIQLLGHLLQVAKNVASEQKLDNGYRVGMFVA